MHLFLLIIILFSSVSGIAKGKPHKHHDAHVHGSATLNIAFDGLSGRIDFKAAADGVVGFEYEAKSEKDKAKLSKVISNFENELSSMIQFDQSLECTFVKDKITLVTEDSAGKKSHAQHADFIAQVNVNCKKSPLGTKITFNFTSLKKVKDIDTTILIGDLQKSVEIKTKPLTIELN